MADKKTSPKVASKASKILKSPATKPAEKSVAASGLSQAAVKDKAAPKPQAAGKAKPKAAPKAKAAAKKATAGGAKAK